MSADIHMNPVKRGFCEKAIDVLQVRGDWRGQVYLNSDSLIEPRVKPLCEIRLREALARQASADLTNHGVETCEPF